MFPRMLGTMLRMKEVGGLLDPRTSLHLTTVAFLAWLKLSVYMAIVSVAIVLSFHLKSESTNLGQYTSICL